MQKIILSRFKSLMSKVKQDVENGKEKTELSDGMFQISNE